MTEILPLINSYLDQWARLSPDKIAIIQHEDGRQLTYKQFAALVDFFALRLIDQGIRPGDRVATMLVLVPEHMALMYACFKIGAIFAPLDVRLKEAEVVRDLAKIEPKLFFFLGNTPVRDFRSVGKAVQDGCPYVERLVQFTPNPQPGDILPGAISITNWMDKKRLVWLKIKDLLTGELAKTYAKAQPTDPALIIFTTGTTGAPKPAAISHRTILIQNELLSRGIRFGAQIRIVVNLPPSHVGCITETFLTPMYMGGSVVILRIFDPKLTLEAIQKWKVNCLGQIPTQFRLEWNLPEYNQFDLSSLGYVIYGGSSVDASFLHRLAKMAPAFGTGMGMTETGGFYTFTPPGLSVEEMAGQVGCGYPDLAQVTVRKPMNPDGTAGEELPCEAIGEICVHPPLVFLGYFNQPEETERVVSKEGILYTGDWGYYKDKGNYQALYLSGRRKFVIKQSGYLVFPDEVEAHIATIEGVDLVDVEGVEHEILGEAIFAIVRPMKGKTLTAEAILDHCKEIASYKRPQYVEFWPEDQPFPLTRSAKVDKLEMAKFAEEVAQRLRMEGE